MADFNSVYTLVKKQDGRIDDLLKTAKSNHELLEGIDSRMKASPSETATPTASTPDEIHVVLPENIATNQSVKELVEAALKQQKIDAIKKLDFSQFPKDIAEAFATAFKNGLDENVKKALHAGIRSEFASQTSDLREAAKQLNNRMYSVINGAIWAAIPGWIYAVVGFIFLAAVGLGIGCCHLYQDNAHLHKVEWLYRYERMWWEGEQRDDLMRREKIFRIGTTHQQDSLKNYIRQSEAHRNIDETFLYFNPTEK